LLALSAATVGCSAGDAEPGKGVGPIGAQELADRISSDTAPVILDVRTREEFASGHIPGAINLPVNEFATGLPALGLAHDEEIVVHCERGKRAAAAESVLGKSGYTQVRDLSGHMQGWRAAAQPVEGDVQPSGS